MANDPCESCRWWRQALYREGECRRESPKGVRLLDATESRANVAVWPMTRADDWCGAWEKARGGSDGRATRA